MLEVFMFIVGIILCFVSFVETQDEEQQNHPDRLFLEERERFLFGPLFGLYGAYLIAAAIFDLPWIILITIAISYFIHRTCTLIMMKFRQKEPGPLFKKYSELWLIQKWRVEPYRLDAFSFIYFLLRYTGTNYIWNFKLYLWKQNQKLMTSSSQW